MKKLVLLAPLFVGTSLVSPLGGETSLVTTPLSVGTSLLSPFGGGTILFCLPGAYRVVSLP